MIRRGSHAAATSVLPPATAYLCETTVEGGGPAEALRNRYKKVPRFKQ
ncbi:hypothetical protein [Nonomuraea basaltis]|nr:hypothetical protein [Nonomuraea basaltis]